jgi:hypothetical protein
MTVKKVKGTWEPHIGKMEMKVEDKVKEVPVFGWSYRVGSIYGGEVHAYPHLGLLLFQTRRGDYPDPGFSGDLKKVVKEIDSFGWGKPPHLEEVYNDVEAASKMVKSDVNGFIEHCKELEKNWENYLQ